MGFAKNWLEEIVSEWLSLECYSVEINVPLKSKAGGGRNEADVLVFMFHGDELHIVHAEATVQLTQSHDDNVEKIKKKFSPNNMDTVLKIARKKYGDGEICSTRHIFVSALASSSKEARNSKETLKTSNIECMDFPELIKNCVDALRRYGKDVSMRRPSDKIFAALPDSLWFMKMLGMMDMYPVLNISEEDT
jgi:hypothetical protein